MGKPLSKKAQRELEARVEEHKVLNALAWPSYPKPQPMSATEIEKKRGSKFAIRAYFMNAYTGSVTAGFTSLGMHAREWSWPVPTTWQQTRNRSSISREPGQCYATALLAARAMRWERTEHAARELRLADKWFENATKDGD